MYTSFYINICPECCLLFSTSNYEEIRSSPINIFPSNTSSVSATINVRSSIQSTEYDINYYAKFSIVNEACFQPALTVFYQDTDFDGVDGTEFLHIFYDNHSISSCGENNDTCNSYKYCLQHQTLGIESVPAGEQIIINLRKGKDSGVPYGCVHSLWANIELTCRGTPSMLMISFS